MECPKCKSENPDDSQFCSKCGTQITESEIPAPTQTIEAPREELTTGSTFSGRYQIIEELGKGGMGKVYKANDIDIKEKVAIKLIKPEISTDKKTIERFQNELKFARKIRHKNVCQMYDLNKEAGTYYITMEYVSGEDLKSFIRRSKQLAMGTAIAIAKQVSEGLAEAHTLGVVHRDLKPSNIMIDRDGNARIMDFGIARSLEAKGITGAGVMIGTPEYMSPEQVEGKEVDQRSDLYSLGVILYEMVTGRVPFEGDTPFTIGVKHKSEIPRNPEELNSQIPDDLSRLILKCLEKDKEKRCQSAGEVRAELESIEKGIPTTERVMPERKPLTSKEITVTFGLKKLLIPAAVIIGLVIAAVVIWQILPSKKATPVPSGEPSLAVMYFENRSDEPDLDNILVDMLTTNLSRFEGIKIVSSQRLFDILKQLGRQDADIIDKNMAMEIAKHAGVATMMTGNIIKLGDRIRISSQLTDVETGTILGSEQVEGSRIEDVFALVDELTERVGTRLNLSTEGEAEQFNISEVSTDSIEAYKYFQKGKEYVWRWSWSRARGNLEKAISIDPTFVTAHLYYAIAHSVWGVYIRDPYFDLTSIRESMELAKEHSSKATEKEKRFIEMYYAFVYRKFEEAERLSLDYVNRYPEDKDGIFLLSLVSYYAEKFDQSRKYAEKLLEIDPTFAMGYNLLAYDLSRMGDYQKAISTIKKYISLQPDEWNPYDSAWEIYMKAGLYDEAIGICRQALKVNAEHPSWQRFYIFEAYSLLFNGEQEKAIDKIRAFGRDFPSRPAWYLYNLGLFYLHQGRYKEFQSEFQKALEFFRSRKIVQFEALVRSDLMKINLELGLFSRVLDGLATEKKLSDRMYDSGFNPTPIFKNYLYGIVSLKKKNYEEAEEFADKIRDLVETEPYDDLYMDYNYLLLAESHIAQEKPQQALDLLRRCTVVMKQHNPRFMIAEAASLALRGDWEDAIHAYRTFANNVEARAYGGDFFYYFLERSKTEYYIAQIYEQQGEKDKAIESYQKFLVVKKHADPGLVEVEDAKKRLAALERQ
jgi:tetratricopeptide (TPR) repeat protein/tRNA A-37 threonylcarbamoyl transferase component Bud32